jgi:hypothetical protein
MCLPGAPVRGPPGSAAALVPENEIYERDYTN